MTKFQCKNNELTQYCSNIYVFNKTDAILKQKGTGNEPIFQNAASVLGLANFIQFVTKKFFLFVNEELLLSVRALAHWRFVYIFAALNRRIEYISSILLVIVMNI